MTLPVTQTRRKDDTRTAIGGRLMRPGGVALNLTGLTVQFKLLNADGTFKVAITAAGVTIQPTSAFTASDTTDRLTAVNHLLKNGDEVLLTTTDTLPAPLALATRFFVVEATKHTFKLATIENGDPIDLTDTGTGTHSFELVGAVTYTPLAADVNTSGRFYAYFVIDASGALDHFPAVQRGYIIVINEDA